MIRHALIIAVLLSAPVAALAQAPAWEADPAHTHIGFSVRHLMVSNVKGEFAKHKVRVVGDPTDAARAQIDVTIDAASINTGVPDRDKHLKSPDFFDVAKYPTIVFKSKKIAKAGKSGLKVTGDLTMHGVTRELVLEARDLAGPIKDPWGLIRLGLQASGTIDRRDYGLKWNKAVEAGGLVVGNEVRIALEVELVQKAPEAAKK
jgi:polyisoprenoid-binding protein YceI